MGVAWPWREFEFPEFAVSESKAEDSCLCCGRKTRAQWLTGRPKLTGAVECRAYASSGTSQTFLSGKRLTAARAQGGALGAGEREQGGNMA